MSAKYKKGDEVVRNADGALGIVAAVRPVLGPEDDRPIGFRYDVSYGDGTTVINDDEASLHAYLRHAVVAAAEATPAVRPMLCRVCGSAMRAYAAAEFALGEGGLLRLDDVAVPDMQFVCDSGHEIPDDCRRAANLRKLLRGYSTLGRTEPNTPASPDYSPSHDALPVEEWLANVGRCVVGLDSEKE